MLRTIVPDLVWTSQMSYGRFGFDVGAWMTVLRLENGDLVVHSPVALKPELRAAVEQLGPVSHVIAPSGMHYEHLAEWAEAYPAAARYGVPALPEKIRAAAGDVQTLTETPPPAWAGQLEQTLVRGSKLYDEAVFCHHASRTLVLTDLCFNVPESSSASTRLWAKALGVLGGLSSSRLFPLAIRDRAAARASIERILTWEFDRVTVSHGEPVLEHGKQEFRRAYAWLLR